MKKIFTPSLVIVLAMIIASTGFVRADIQLCQTRCEYSLLDTSAPPPCCKAKGGGTTHVMVKTDHDASIPTDCPHFDSNREIFDPLTFISASKTLPAPPQAAGFTAVLITMPAIPDTGFYGYARYVGLSPPGKKRPPVYRLNCSLLI